MTSFRVGIVQISIGCKFFCGSWDQSILSVKLNNELRKYLPQSRATYIDLRIFSRKKTLS